MQHDEGTAKLARAARVGNQPPQEREQHVEQQHAWCAQESEILTRATRHVLRLSREHACPGPRGSLTGDRVLRSPRGRRRLEPAARAEGAECIHSEEREAGARVGVEAAR